MTRSLDDPAILCDLVLAVLVGEELAANGAGPVFAVAVLGAGVAPEFTITLLLLLSTN